MTRERAFRHAEFGRRLRQRPRLSCALPDTGTERQQARTLRHRQVKRQHIHYPDLIKDQLINAFAAAAGGVVVRQRQRAYDKLTQQRGDLHHLTAGRQVSARQRIDKQRACSDLTARLQRVLRAGGQPDPAAGRHHPAAVRRLNPYHATQGVDQLRAGVMVPRLAGAVCVIVRKRYQRAPGKIEAYLFTHPRVSARRRQMPDPARRSPPPPPAARAAQCSPAPAAGSLPPPPAPVSHPSVPR